MGSQLVLKLTPVAGTRLAKVYSPAKMDGLDYVPLVMLGTETGESAEQQIRDLFPRFAAAKNGSLETTITLAKVVKPVKKPLSTILACARADDGNLLDLDTEERNLTVYIDFKAPPRAKGKDQHFQCTALL